MNREPIKIIGDILKNCMSLTDDQLWIYNQDFKIPETKGLFIVLQRNTAVTYSATNNFIPADEGEVGAQEMMNVRRKEDYTVNVMSKNSDARLREHEVALSLNSNYSENEQEKYQFRIARIGTGSVNVSELEGAGMLNRFAINVSLLAWYNKTIDTPYYDTFTNQVEID